MQTVKVARKMVGKANIIFGLLGIIGFFVAIRVTGDQWYLLGAVVCTVLLVGGMCLVVSD